MSLYVFSSYYSNAHVSLKVDSFVPTGLELTLWNAVAKTFASDLSFNDLRLGVEIWKILLQKDFLNHKTKYFS